MSPRLDLELQSLKAEAPDAPLGDLEGAVWRGIAAAREARRASPGVLLARAAAVFTALGIGVAGGGIAASPPQGAAAEASVFAVDSPLAPSTLLDGGR